MRAVAVFPGRRELRMIEVPAPARRSEREAIVRIREVGICGTDREIAAFHYGKPAPGGDRLVLGHEALGQVVEVGSAVRTLVPGDLVALTVRRPCNDPGCVACGVGRQDFCTSGGFTERGIKGADGYLTELVVEEEQNLVRVPRALAEVGALIEPLTVTAKAAVDLDAILRRYPWEPLGLRALVLGAGPIGLLSAMMLVARNARTFVYSLEPADSDRAQLTRSFGAEYVSVGDTALADLPARVGSADIVFEAVGTAKVAFGAQAALAPNGVFILSGMPSPRAPIEIDLDRIMRDIVLKNQVLFGTVNASRGAFEAAVRQLEQFMGLFPAAVRSLITHGAKLDDVPELLRQPRGIKQVVTLAA
ncbi:MAG TPA: glucose 1-dehydrogenase [Polyangia bacterium]|nr:glucose 1-dehydrogenase [Polyangia bacterium]